MIIASLPTDFDFQSQCELISMTLKGPGQLNMQAQDVATLHQYIIFGNSCFWSCWHLFPSIYRDRVTWLWVPCTPDCSSPTNEQTSPIVGCSFLPILIGWLGIDKHELNFSTTQLSSFFPSKAVSQLRLPWSGPAAGAQLRPKLAGRHVAQQPPEPVLRFHVQPDLGWHELSSRRLINLLRVVS